jgi:hypothetical protein
MISILCNVQNELFIFKMFFSEVAQLMQMLTLTQYEIIFLSKPKMPNVKNVEMLFVDFKM